MPTKLFLGFFGPRERGDSSGLGFSPTVLAKEDFEGRKGDDGFSPTVLAKEDFEGRKGDEGFSPPVLAKEDIEGTKGDEGPSDCSRLCSVGFSSLGQSKSGEGFLSGGTFVLSSSSTPVSSSPLHRRFSPTSDTLISYPNSLRESQMGCSGVVFNSMIGKPTSEGVESFEKAYNQLLKNNSDTWRYSSNPEVHDDSKKVTQDLDSLVLEGFQVEDLTTQGQSSISFGGIGN